MKSSNKSKFDFVVLPEEWKCFDGCPVCRLLKKASEEGREIDSKELEKAYKRYKAYASYEWGSKMEVPVEWKAILAAMKALENKGENEVRVVFWFDN